MVVISRCLSSLAVLLSGVQGARVTRKKHSSKAPSTKFVAGVPVLNYDLAFGGTESLSALDESREAEWLFTLQPGVTNAQIAAFCKLARQGCLMSGHPDQGGVAFLDMRGTEQDLEAVLQSNPGLVEFVEPDQIMYTIPEPELLDEPSTSPSWGLNRVGAGGRSSNQGAGTNIYILDTGVRSTHADFGGRATPAFDAADNGRECNGDLGCAADRQGHGTHCAGTAAGTTFGVASRANVGGVKVLGDNGSGSFAQVIAGIDWVAASGARPAVMSMSLGGACPHGNCERLKSTRVAIERAVARMVTVVVAAGNSNRNACVFSPAYIPAAITVGSTDSEDARSFFSNRGKCTDIWAPGSAITSATHEDDAGSKTFSGTSMACPHVAGAAAMILERKPDLKPSEVLQRLLDNAATGYVTGLTKFDKNTMLYVAADAPPPKGEVPPPGEPNCPFFPCKLGVTGMCMPWTCQNNCEFC